MSEYNSWSKKIYGQKNLKKSINYVQFVTNHPQLCLIMHARYTILHIQWHIITTKAHNKFQPNWIKIFREKVEKVKKA